MRGRLDAAGSRSHEARARHGRGPTAAGARRPRLLVDDRQLAEEVARRRAVPARRPPADAHGAAHDDEQAGADLALETGRARRPPNSASPAASASGSSEAERGRRRGRRGPGCRPSRRWSWPCSPRYRVASGGRALNRPGARRSGSRTSARRPTAGPRMAPHRRTAAPGGPCRSSEEAVESPRATFGHHLHGAVRLVGDPARQAALPASGRRTRGNRRPGPAADRGLEPLAAHRSAAGPR